MHINPETLALLRDLGEPGEENPLIELIDLFLDDAPKTIERIKKAAAERNPQELKEAAHTLKGSSGNLGADDLAGLCRDLEVAAKDGSVNEIEALVRRIEEEFGMAKEALLLERAA